MVTAELNLGVPLEVDLAHERFGLTPDVRRNGDALPHDRLPAQWGSGSLCPLREARADLAIGVKKTHGLAFTGEKLLEQGSVPETRHCLDCVPSLIGIDHESRTDARSLADTTGTKKPVRWGRFPRPRPAVPADRGIAPSPTTASLMHRAPRRRIS